MNSITPTFARLLVINVLAAGALYLTLLLVGR
jgi:hypothetical protein